MNRRAAAQSGFSLIEVIIGLALFGLILVLLFDGLRIGAATLGRLDAEAESLDLRRGLDGVLRRQFSSAVPGGAADRADFAGAPGSVMFLASGGAGGGLYHMRLALEDDAGAGRLVLERRAATAFDRRTASGERIVLASGVRSLRLAYYGAPVFSDRPSPERPGWQDEWRSATGLPALIRVHIEIAGDRGPAWPDLLVPLRAEAIRQ